MLTFDQIATIRAYRKQNKPTSRADHLAWAYARGRPHERLEARVSEHNLPHAILVVRALRQALGLDPDLEWRVGPEAAQAFHAEQAQVARWCPMPEERIRRFGPHQPRQRPAGTSKPPCLYLVVRADLPAAQQAVQAAHALQQFNLEHPSEAQTWARNSNTIAFLSVPGEEQLHLLTRRAANNKIASSLFMEPDLLGQKTALALAPRGKKLCRDLPLALG